MRHCGSCKKEYEVSAYAGYCSYGCKKSSKGKRIPQECTKCAQWEIKYNEVKLKWEQACKAYKDLKADQVNRVIPELEIDLSRPDLSGTEVG